VVHTAQPRPVLVEVRARRADEDRPCAQLAHAEGDVRTDSAPAYVEVVDQEGQGDRVQLVRDELVGETAGEGHEVVGGDGAGDCDTHGWDTLLRGKGDGRFSLSGESPPRKQEELPDSRAFFLASTVFTVSL